MNDLVTRRQRRIVTGALLVVLLVLLLPYVWLVLTSFKDRVDIFNGDILRGFTPTLDNYHEAFVAKGFLKNLVNSTIIAAAATTLALLIGVPAAYALSRTSGRGGALVLFVLLAGRLMPAIVLAVPLFILFADLKLLGTYPAPIIAHLTFLVPFVAWMMRGFFLAVPTELDEAATIDGASRHRFFLSVMLPMTRGGMAATAIFCVINSWNELLYGLIFTNRTTATLPVAVPGLLTPIGTFWGQIAAVGVVTTVPMLIFALLVQRHIVRGMTGGALAGT